MPSPISGRTPIPQFVRSPVRPNSGPNGVSVKSPVRSQQVGLLSALTGGRGKKSTVLRIPHVKPRRSLTPQPSSRRKSLKIATSPARGFTPKMYQEAPQVDGASLLSFIRARRRPRMGNRVQPVPMKSDVKKSNEITNMGSKKETKSTTGKKPYQYNTKTSPTVKPLPKAAAKSKAKRGARRQQKMIAKDRPSPLTCDKAEPEDASRPVSRKRQISPKYSRPQSALNPSPNMSQSVKRHCTEGRMHGGGSTSKENTPITVLEGGKAVDNEVKPKTWFDPEIRALKRTVVRPDLDPRHPDYWTEVANAVNVVALGRNKAKREPKTGLECKAMIDELEAADGDEIASKSAKPKAKAKQEKRTVAQRLKGSTKAWELNKMVNERAFKNEKTKLNIINKANAPEIQPAELTSASPSKDAIPFPTMRLPTPQTSPPRAGTLDIWAAGTPTIKSTGVFKDTPLGKAALELSRRGSVDWDMLTEMGTDLLGVDGKKDAQNGDGQKSARTSTGLCELYQDLDGPQDLDHVRGVQRMQKILKNKKGKSNTKLKVLQPRTDLLGGAQRKTLDRLQKKAVFSQVGQLIHEYREVVLLMRDASGDEQDNLKQEALSMAENLLEVAEQNGLVHVGADWDLLYSASEANEYDGYIAQLESVMKAEA